MKSLAQFCFDSRVAVARLASPAYEDGVGPAIGRAAETTQTLTSQMNGALFPLQSILAGCVYALLFLRFAIGSEERGWYERKIRQVIKRPRTAAAV
jgi:hypothetical protein